VDLLTETASRMSRKASMLILEAVHRSQLSNVPMSNSLLANGAARGASDIDGQAERPKRAGANESILSEFRSDSTYTLLNLLGPRSRD
jgi:hypothetical protein